MKKLLIATKNKGKFTEIAEVLKTLPVQLLSLEDVGIADDVEEHGTTHEENAILKARFYFDKVQLPTIGEDSGVYVDAFPGQLGVYTRRWQGLGEANDEQWIKKFLEELQSVPMEKRGAHFVTCAALIIDKKSYEEPSIFVGETHGVITENLEAPLKKGIPISSCFKPEGFTKVYAALETSEKNRVSHRGKAMHKVKAFLEKNLLV